MSHLDDLDEYEAELELRLKKEYQAVFSLFRYCVLTPDATYLCNKLERTYAPQPAYPFFHLVLEDVWVWDKNRPTRMIPRTEIFHVRRRDDRGAARRRRRARADAEALASASATLVPLARRTTCCSRLPLRARSPMLLAVDVGNTQTVFGLYDGDGLGERWRIATEAQRTGDELGALLARLARLRRARRHLPVLDGAALVREYEHFAERWAQAPLLVSGRA